MSQMVVTLIGLAVVTGRVVVGLRALPLVVGVGTVPAALLCHFRPSVLLPDHV